MSIGDWFKRLLAAPSAGAQESAEEDAARREEYGTADAGEADLERMAETGGGTSLAASGAAVAEGAEAAEEDLASEEAPPDPAP